MHNSKKKHRNYITTGQNFEKQMFVHLHRKGTLKIWRVYVKKKTDTRKLLLRMTNLKY